MTALSATDRRALRNGAAILALLLGYALVIRPSLSATVTARADLQQQRELLARERALVAAIPRLPAARLAADQALASSRSRLVPGDSVSATAALARYVADVALASGVRVGSIEGRAPVPHGAIVDVTVDLRADATYAQALQFLHTLEVADYSITVPSLRIDHAAAGGGLALQATISGAAVARP